MKLYTLLLAGIVVACAALLHCGQALSAELTDTESKLLDLMLKDLLEAKREDTKIEAKRNTYPGYAEAPAGAPPGGQDPLYGYFSAVAGADQQIDTRELQQCLTSSGIAGSYEQFSMETCRIMIAMLDRDYSGLMGFNEFKELWAALNQWKNTFTTYDRDHSGTVDPTELHQAIVSWGYNLSPQALNIISKRYSTNGHVKFDDFIAAAIRLRMLTDQFRRRDTAQNGQATFQYDDFIQVAMFS